METRFSVGGTRLVSVTIEMMDRAEIDFYFIRFSSFFFFFFYSSFSLALVFACARPFVRVSRLTTPPQAVKSVR